ncbi:aldo/keto reductase [Pseudobacter ginsenosidimutans]|uniref:Helix-turn-helix protein n=1 Tax=Pseudobacter ginsenosidimutans TaxID=661488 RepID=A0A4Q7MLH6_9BACT|nr:aldo/keto reductase [Pseudobacter ginsenosidimutans]RZS69215.1 helix-turn-helix protein [Pseudobacter ginsenosidimutans]
MKTVKLGSQGLEVPRLGLGCMGMTSLAGMEIYGKADEAEAIATIHRSLRLGGNFLDTADLYGPLLNEQLIAKAINGNRSKYIIATKFGFEIDDNDQLNWQFNGSRNYVKKAAERSLKNLGTDHIDLYYLHRVDFDEGMLSFISPNQILTNLSKEDYSLTGYSLSFHPDFIRNYPLGRKIKNYGFFSYEANEALHLSEQEEQMIGQMMIDMEREYQNSIDHFSQDIMVARLELLLSYSDRFYNRQFITRKASGHDLLLRMEQALNNYFNREMALRKGMPTVELLAAELNLSPGYLSDMLRSLTGQTAQQHIHNVLIEKAKELLAGTQLSVSEIAYQFGFEYPQSFNKLFKNKTSQTPLQYRQTFN